MTAYSDILSDADILEITSMPEVVSFMSSFGTFNIRKQNIIITLPVEMTNKINDIFNINVTSVPFTLIKGDTHPHKDTGSNEFNYTHLIYLNDNIGQIIIDSVSYNITKKTGFKFSEGLIHETVNTGNDVRMLIGPMDHLGSPVGWNTGIYYYENQEDAENNKMSEIARSDFYVVGESVVSGSIGSYTHWRINNVYAFNTDVEDLLNNSTTIYANGDVLPETGFSITYFMYPVEVDNGNICFAKGTPIKTDQGIIEINNIDIKTHTIDGKPIIAITKSVSEEKYLVKFCKGSLGENIPIDNVTVSANHKIYHNGKLQKAIDLVNGTTIKKRNYNGEVLYNILLESYLMVSVNGMICETLEPTNLIAKKYLS